MQLRNCVARPMVACLSKNCVGRDKALPAVHVKSSQLQSSCT